MFKRASFAALVFCLAMAPALAKNLAVPEKDPIATVTIPDTWKMEEIDYGYSAKSPDGDVQFYFEYASQSRVDKMM